MIDNGDIKLFNKKLMVLTIFLVSLVAVSAVSAAENGNEYLNTLEADEIGDEQVVETINDEPAGPNGTFTDLASKIAGAEGELNLTRDYTFSDYDYNYLNGIFINKSIVINGNGFTIDGKNQAKAFEIYSSNVTLNDICFVNCYSEKGGVIYLLDSNVNLNGAAFINNSGTYGGSIFSFFGNLSIDNSVFVNDTASYAPAIFSHGGSLIINNSQFMDLESSVSSGAVAVKMYENLIIENCNFTNTRSTKNGGAIFIDSGGVKTSDIVIIRNVSFVNAYGDFGGAFMQLSGKLIMQDLTFVNCTSKYDGGAVYLSNVNAYISNAEFISNKATLYDDYQTFGGAIYFDSGNLTLANSKFIDNSAYGGSGVVCIYDSRYKIADSIFDNNGEAIHVIFKHEESEIINLTGSDTVSENNVFYPYVISGIGQNLTVMDSEIVDSLPARYDLRDYNWTSTVKYQGLRGACWAFADIETLESVLLRFAGLNVSLSINNMQNLMIMYSKYGINYLEESGFSMLSMAYLLSWLGAVPQEYDTYDELGKISPVINTSENIHVQDFILLPMNVEIIGGDPSIKQAILKYGALSNGIYGIVGNENNTFYYNEKTHSQYVPDDIGADHSISIVGWDDTFSRENFLISPPGDGAWIIQSSWGTSFGDNGYYYVSYYDKTLRSDLNNFNDRAFAIIVNNTVPYNKNYQYEFACFNGFYNLTDESVTYVNKFVSIDDDYIAAVGTYFNQSGVNYNVAVEVNGEIVLTQDGVSPYCGYHTIKLNEYIPIKKGDNFSIHISSNVIPFSAFSRSYCKEGVSLALINDEWYDLYSEWDIVACIKAYTVDEIEPPKQNVSIAVSYDSANGVLTATLTNNKTGKDIAGADMIVNINDKTYRGKTDNNGQFKVSTADLAPGTYVAAVSYGGDDTYNAFNTTAQFTVKANTALSLYYDENANELIATLTNNATGKAIKGVNVVVKLNGVSSTIKTDADGQVRVSTADLAPGTYTATATYKGGSKYNSTKASEKIIIKANTALSMEYNDKVKELVVTLINNYTGQPIKGVSVVVKVSDVSLIVKTDADGQLRVSTVDLAPGTYTATATYKGSSKYNSTKASEKLTVKVVTSLSAVYNANSNELVVTLINSITGKTLSGGKIAVSINGKDYSVKTNSSGQAKVSTKDLVPGSYTALVTYNGTSRYWPSNTSVDFTVKTSTTISAVYNVDAKELVATLINDVTSQPVLGATVKFKINGVVYSIKTDNGGQAKLSVADLPLGTYVATVSYGGNSKYNPSSVDINVPIKADTILNVVYNANDGELVATLTNNATDQPIKGATVAVVLNNVRSNLKTDTNGQVRVSTADLDSGVYPVVVSYAGNAKYNSTQTTLDIVIGVKTSISADYKDGILTATLTDNATGKGINGADLLVDFGDVEYTVKTNSNGQANVSTKDLAPGTYTATVSYNGAGSTSSSTSIPIEVKVYAYFIVEDLTADYNTNVELAATLINYATGKGIVGATVGFKINGKSYSAKTDANGQAKYNLSGLNPGIYSTVVSYNGNTKYTPAKETFDVVVNKITTSIAVYYDSQSNEVVATLINEVTGDVVKGGTIGIFLNNVKHIIVTDMSGQVRLSLGDVDLTSFTAYVTYAGNAKYLASSRILTPVENKVESYISTVYNKETDEVIATLINKATDKGVVGGTVSVVVNNVRNDVKTDTNGQARVSIAGLAPNVYKVVSSYAGNTKYTATTETIYITKT